MTRERFEPFLDISPERGYEEQLRDQADKAGPPADMHETDTDN
jgi:hypothetical protein